MAGKSSIHEPRGVGRIPNGVDARRCCSRVIRNLQNDPGLAKYNIGPSRIVTVKEKNYVGESQATIQHHLKHFPALRKCLILSDAGAHKKDVDIVK